MLAQPSTTKWLIHGYETCGYANVKRPMLGMLREGLNHHDRIPHDTKGFAISGWVRHIVAHYHKLPDLLFFTKPDTPAASRVFLPRGKGSIQDALAESPDFSLWGAHLSSSPLGRAPTLTPAREPEPHPDPNLNPSPQPNPNPSPHPNPNPSPHLNPNRSPSPTPTPNPYPYPR